MRQFELIMQIGKQPRRSSRYRSSSTLHSTPIARKILRVLRKVDGCARERFTRPIEPTFQTIRVTKNGFGLQLGLNHPCIDYINGYWPELIKHRSRAPMDPGIMTISPDYFELYRGADSQAFGIFRTAPRVTARHRGLTCSPPLRGLSKKPEYVNQGQSAAKNRGQVRGREDSPLEDEDTRISPESRVGAVCTSILTK